MNLINYIFNSDLIYFKNQLFSLIFYKKKFILKFKLIIKNVLEANYFQLKNDKDKYQKMILQMVLQQGPYFIKKIIKNNKNLITTTIITKKNSFLLL